jgi:DNA-binding MarR family transcriptional regulator
MSEKRTPLTETHVSAWAGMVRASERILQAVEEELKTAGLPPLSWYDLLLELRRAEPVGLRPYQLQSAMLIPQSNMSRLIDRVAKAGYAERRSCDEDERGQIISITPDGKALQQKMWPNYRSVLEREFAAKLAEGEAERLAKLLHPLTSANPATPSVVSISGTRRAQ